MKSEYVRKDDLKMDGDDYNYPLIMVADTLVVLMTENEKGTVLHLGPKDAEIYHLGEQVEDWGMDCFIPMEKGEKVILEN